MLTCLLSQFRTSCLLLFADKGRPVGLAQRERERVRERERERERERCGRKVRMRKLGESADSEVGSGSIGFFPERVRFVAHDKREPQLERRARGRTLRGAAASKGSVKYHP